MKTQAKEKTPGEIRISYASNRMCEIQKVLAQLWVEDGDAIKSHMSFYKYSNPNAIIPIGITIILCLNPALFYPDSVLNTWRRRLKAQDYAVGIHKSHLRAAYHIKFKEKNEGTC